MRYRYSSSSVGTITQGLVLSLKQIFTKSSFVAFKLYKKYLGLKDINKSFPLSVTGIFSFKFPSSEFEVMQMLFSLMSNSRYVYVIRRLVLQEAEPKVVALELNTNVDNLYNIKKRAIAALTEVALNEVEKYEKGISK